MTDSNLVERAALVSRLAHKGQFRRDGVTPYFTHPEAVAAKCVSNVAKAVAYLHDVIEDTGIRAEHLLKLGFSEDIVRSVVRLTRYAGESYEDYIKILLSNPVAVEVKIADMEHNLSCQPSEHSKQKIAKWLPILKEQHERFKGV